MSFGYSVGDFITGANITYRLIRVLADSSGASEEYQEAMLELSAMQQAFLQVSQMTQNPVIPQATINSASHIVMSAMDIISHFLDRSRLYQKKLGGGTNSSANEGSMSRIEEGWTKVGWSLFKKEELKDLRDRLHSRLSSIQLLLSASAYCTPLSKEVSIYQIPPPKAEADLITTTADISPPADDSSRMLVRSTTLVAENRPRSPESSTASATQLHLQDPFNEDLSEEAISSAGQADTFSGRIVKEMNQLSSQWLADLTVQRVNPDTIDKLRKILVDGIQALNAELVPPILITDAVGRKFRFPYRLVMTWAGIHGLLKEAFRQIETLGYHVAEGHYDLMGPSGEILLPPVWERVLVPGMSIKMTMWPMPKEMTHPRFPPPPPPLPLPEKLARHSPNPGTTLLKVEEIFPSIPPSNLKKGAVLPLSKRGRSEQKRSRSKVVRKSQSSWTTESSDDDNSDFGSSSVRTKLSE